MMQHAPKMPMVFSFGEINKWVGHFGFILSSLCFHLVPMGISSSFQRVHKILCVFKDVINFLKLKIMKLQLSKWKSNLKCWKSYSHTLDVWIKGLSLDLLPWWCHNLDDEPKLELWLVTYTTPQIKIVHHLTCPYNWEFFNIFSFLNQIEQFFVSLDVEIGGPQLYFWVSKV
jgi:hypothetical protein